MNPVCLIPHPPRRIVEEEWAGCRAQYALGKVYHYDIPLIYLLHQMIWVDDELSGHILMTASYKIYKAISSGPKFCDVDHESSSEVGLLSSVEVSQLGAPW